jgi:hypothetical protein
MANSMKVISVQTMRSVSSVSVVHHAPVMSAFRKEKDATGKRRSVLNYALVFSALVQPNVIRKPVAAVIHASA